MSKLKVYVTPIGFHDAYVAATSQKAALEAWGADANLFARGAASLVADGALAEEPLAKPGTVIKRLRGTAAEQIAALDTAPSPAKAKSNKPEASAIASPARAGVIAPRRATVKAKPKKVTPRPSRRALDAADEKLASVQARFRAEQRAVIARIAELQQERQSLREAEEKEIAALERLRDVARERYQAAVERWASIE